jgi:hypothetical protein
VQKATATANFLVNEVSINNNVTTGYSENMDESRKFVPLRKKKNIVT